MKSLIRLLPLVSVFFFLTSCYPSQVATTSGAMMEPDLLYSNSWDLVELNGTPISQNGDRYSYITFTPGTNRLSGYTSCNYIGGTVSLRDANGISFSPIVTTDNNCASNTIDASLLPALRTVENWSVVDDHLVMTRNGKTIARWAPSAYTNEDLYGNWQLTYVSDNSMPFDVLYPVDRRPVLMFDKSGNAVSGNTGFNTYNCPVRINSNGIAFADCTVTKMACEGPGEAIFMEDLKDINNYRFTDENTLVFFTDDDTVMRFTRIK